MFYIAFLLSKLLVFIYLLSNKFCQLTSQKSSLEIGHKWANAVIIEPCYLNQGQWFFFVNTFLSRIRSPLSPTKLENLIFLLRIINISVNELCNQLHSWSVFKYPPPMNAMIPCVCKSVNCVLSFRVKHKKSWGCWGRPGHPRRSWGQQEASEVIKETAEVIKAASQSAAEVI